MSTVCQAGWVNKRTSTGLFCISLTVLWLLGLNVASDRRTASSSWVWGNRSPLWERWIVIKKVLDIKIYILL